MTDDRDERLSRLIDGALPPEDIGSLEPGDLARLRRIARADDAAREVFGAVPSGPDHAAVVRTAFRRRSGRSWRHWVVPSVAAAAAVLVAFVGLEQRFDARLDTALADMRAERDADFLMIATAMQQVLETEASGTPVMISNDATGTAMTLLPTRTWRSESGHWCRAFAEIPEGMTAEEAPVTTACRDDSGRWLRVATEFHTPLIPVWEARPRT